MQRCESPYQFRGRLRAGGRRFAYGFLVRNSVTSDYRGQRQPQEEGSSDLSRTGVEDAPTSHGELSNPVPIIGRH